MDMQLVAAGHAAAPDDGLVVFQNPRHIRQRPGTSGVQVFSLLRLMAARGVFQRNTAPYRSAGNSARIAG